MGDVLTKSMLEASKTIPESGSLMRNLAKITITDADSVILDSDIVKNIFETDTTTGEGHYVDMSEFSSKEFRPPEYNTFTHITVAELRKRMIGRNDQEGGASVVELAIERQEKIRKWHENSIEKQAFDGMFNGKIILASQEEITFNKPEENDIIPTDKWDTASGKAIDDITKGCTLSSNSGKVHSNEFFLLGESVGINALLDNTQFKARANYGENSELARIIMDELGTGPNGEKLPSGACYHGKFSAGNNIVHLIGYDRKYEVPKGIGLAGEGSKKSFMPTAGMILMPRGVRFDLTYCGLDPLVNTEASMDKICNVKLLAQKHLPYLYSERKNGKGKMVTGSSTRPLFIPTDVDSVITIRNVATV